jgi:adenine-specific DNA-methyltransferase
MSIEKILPEDPIARSADVRADNIAQLRSLFPELITEGAGGAAIKVDVLKQLVGDATASDTEEKYGLNWHGKRRARQLALTPSTGTLRPCPEDSVDWDTTQNLMIEGDNLEVLKLLQKSYASKVKLIYIDPPYNTGKDFVYPDNFQDNIKNYLELTGQVEGGRKISSNSDASGRFHTDWLSMMYPRLKLGKNLLRADGVMLISIDEREYSHLRAMCVEIFGEENIVGTVVWKNATDNNPTNVATEHEYVLIVAKGKEALEKEWKSSVSDIKDVLVDVGNQLTAKYSGDELRSAYEAWFKDHKSELWPLDRYKYIDKGGVYTGSQSVHNPGKEGYRYDVIHPSTQKPCKQPLMGYRFPRDTMDKLLEEGRILFGDDETKLIELKVYASEYRDKLASVLELDGRLGAYDLRDDFPDEGKVFSNPKPVRLFTTFFPFLLKQDGDLVLDFFAGSGATAKAAMELTRKDAVRRRFCLVQLPQVLDPEDNEQKLAAKLCDKLGKPRTIAEVTKERLRRAGRKASEADPTFAGDNGFRVYKLDHSNIRAWQPTGDLEKDLIDSVEHIAPGRSEQDILTELALKLGLDLCVPIEQRQIADKTVHAIGGGVLLTCLATRISKQDAEPLAMGIAEWHQALAPAGDTTCVFRDSAFENDEAKTNLAAILDQHGIRHVRSL